MKNAIITVSIKRKTAARRQRYIGLFARLTLTFLAASAAARVLILTADIIAARAGSFGGEITLPFYVAIFVYFGWSLRGWADAARRAKKKRKENTPCTSIIAEPADATSTLARLAPIAERRPKSAL